MIRRIRRDPRPFVLILVGLAILGAFLLVVSPLFAASGKPKADLGGVIPSTAKVGTPFEVDVGYDNTGDNVINPTCVLIDVTGPLDPSSVSFQGLDVATVKDGEACGGSLNAQETISMKIVMTTTAPGTARVTLTPAQGINAIGVGVTGTVTVTVAS